MPENEFTEVMKAKSGVEDSSRRSAGRRLRLTTWEAHPGESMMEWKSIEG